MTDPHLDPPFPWLGGKRAVTEEVWRALGNPQTYCEPFAGGAAVFLARPRPFPGMFYEFLNDLDGNITNVWRAVQNNPTEVWEHVNAACSEHDIFAWKHIISKTYEERVRRLREDPRWYDAEIAGKWIWGQCFTIGGAWVTPSTKASPTAGYRQGLLSNRTQGEMRLRKLSLRLQNCHILQGDWERSLRLAQTLWAHHKIGAKAVFLDPPYATTDRSSCYLTDDPSVAKDVEKWCLENEKDWKIVLAGHVGNYDLPWRMIQRSAHPGYAAKGNPGKGRENAQKECLWISPSCGVNVEESVLDLLG